MTTREIIERELAKRNIKVNGTVFFKYNEDDTRVTVYDMDIETFSKKKIAYYLVPFNNLVKA